MYCTPDGKEAIVVAEAYKRLRLPRSADDEAAVSIADARVRRHQPRRLLDRRRFAIFTCEFNGSLTKIDLVNRKVSARCA
jgi:hypothetical protein